MMGSLYTTILCILTAVFLLLLNCMFCDASKPIRNGSVVYFQEDAWLRSNGTECAAVKAGHLPNVILQIGQMRTASTLQYATILLLAQLYCPGATIKSGFVHRTRDMRDVLAEQLDPNVLQIYKTHTWDHIDQLPKNAWVFVSIYDEKNTSNTILYMKQTHGRDVSYIQNMTFIRNSLSIGDLHAYEGSFPMSTFPIQQLTKALNKWRLMRLCCGSQMSTTWRNTLMHDAALMVGARKHMWILSQRLSRKNTSVPAAHMCNSVDFNEMERDMFGHLEKMNIPLSLLPFGSHAPIVPYVGWCECTVQLTQKLKLDINSVQYKQCELVTHNIPQKAPKHIQHLIQKYKLDTDDDKYGHSTESQTKNMGDSISKGKKNNLL